MEKNNNSKKVLIASLITVVFILSLVAGIVVGLSQKANPVANNENEKVMADAKDKKTTKKEEYIKEKKEELNIKNEEDIKESENEDSKIEQENYSDDYKEYLEKTEEEKKEIEVIPRKREVKEEELEKIIEKEQEIIEENKKEEEIIEPEKETINPETGLPYSFNLKDVITINVGNQGGFGLCWDFASMKCVETNLALTQGKNYDFSEIFVDYLASNELANNGRGAHEGGNFDMFMNYVERVNGFVEEDKLEYRDYPNDEYISFIDMDLVDESVFDYIDFPNYNKTYSDWTEEQFKEYQNTIKNHIMNFGSLYLSTEAPSTESIYMYSADFEDVQLNPIKDGHAMSIVGWDDNFSKEKFTSRSGKHPEKDGAYIVLNSWGNSYGDGGYCYISYEDYCVHRDLSGVISTNKKDLINLSEMNNKKIAEFLEREYKDRIIVYNNNKYLNKICLDEYEYDLSNLGLTSLDGIDLFQNAYSLNLSNNNLTDVSDLNNIKFKRLKSLDLSNNPNVSGWEDLNYLNNLKLSNCNITDISGFSKWVDRNEYYLELDLSNNPDIEGLEILKTLKVTSLKLANCNIKDLSILVSENVYNLDLSGNKEIENIKEINDFENLYVLTLNDCDIKDASIFDEIHYIDMVDLSYNKGIKNINKIKTGYLSLQNCDIENLDKFTETNNIYEINLRNNKIKDITPLKDTGIQAIYLSGNKNITGDLEGKYLDTLELNDCNLNSEFNFFNLKEVGMLYLVDNNLKIEDVLGKIKCNAIEINEKVSEDEIININSDTDNDNMINLSGLIIEKTVKVPSGNIRIFKKDLLNRYNGKIEFKNGIVNNAYNYIEFNPEKADSLIINNYNDWEKGYYQSTLIIKFEIDDTIKPKKLVATKPLKQSVYNTGENFSSDGLKVAEVYENGIYKSINDYELIVPEQFMFGENEIKIVKDNIEGIIKIKYKGIENEKDTFTLTFKSKELFEAATSWFDMEILIADVDNKTMVLKGSARTKLSKAGVWINDNTLYDIESLKDLDILDITIQYYGNKITLEDLERIKSTFPNMKELYVINYTDEPNESIIPEQDLFKIKIYKDDSVG